MRSGFLHGRDGLCFCEFLDAGTVFEEFHPFGLFHGERDLIEAVLFISNFLDSLELAGGDLLPHEFIVI